MQVVVKLVDPLSNSSFLAHAFVEAFVSMKRYQLHLFGSANQSQPKLRKSKSSISQSHSEDESDESSRLIPSATIASSSSGLVHRCIQVQNAVFAWSRSNRSNSDDVTFKPNENFRVSIKDLEICRGECVFIVGTTGSGKSSILLSLLGEMVRLKGYVFVSRTTRVDDFKPSNRTTKPSKCVSYTSQSAWIPEGTVRSTILFGRPYDPVRYRRTIEACELAAVSHIITITCIAMVVCFTLPTFSPSFSPSFSIPPFPSLFFHRFRILRRGNRVISGWFFRVVRT